MPSSHIAAPEVISAKASYNGEKADIWSSAVMLYVMLFCEYPFERPEDEADKYGFQKVRLCIIHIFLAGQISLSACLLVQVLDRIVKVDYRLPKAPKVSAECRDLLHKLLVANPDERLSIPQIQAHPWYRKGLPPNVIKMNEQCLKLRPHEHPGYQSIATIKEIVRTAGEWTAEKEDNDGEIDQFIDEALDMEEENG